MKKFALLVGSLLLVSATASAATLCTDLNTLAQYISAGSCDLANGQTFSNFSWTGPFSGLPGGITVDASGNSNRFTIPASSVIVTVTGADTVFGLNFASTLFDNIKPGTTTAGRTVAGSLNITLGYTLSLPAANPLYGSVDGVSALVSGFHHTGSSSMSFNTTESDHSDFTNVVTLSMNETSTSAFDVFVPRVQAMDIVEYIGLTALRGTNDVIGFSSFDNSFSVPEPMTAILLGSGLVALSLAGRRLRSVK